MFCRIDSALGRHSTRWRHTHNDAKAQDPMPTRPPTPRELPCHQHAASTPEGQRHRFEGQPRERPSRKPQASSRCADAEAFQQLAFDLLSASLFGDEGLSAVLRRQLQQALTADRALHAWPALQSLHATLLHPRIAQHLSVSKSTQRCGQRLLKLLDELPQVQPSASAPV